MDKFISVNDACSACLMLNHCVMGVHSIHMYIGNTSDPACMLQHMNLASEACVCLVYVRQPL